MTANVKKPALRLVSGGMHTVAEVREDEIAAPSIITPLHVMDRETSKVAGAPRAWRKLSTLEHAYRQERLGDIDSKEARDRLSAGNFFTKLWDTSQSAGRDSTLAFDFRGQGQGVPLSEAQRASIARLVAIEMRLGRVDRTIIRATCAFGNSPAEAMRLAKLGKLVHVTSRMCEALDALADAIECTAKRGRKN